MPLITFEGVDCSGKSTVIKHCSDYLTQQGIEHVLTREPGGTVFAEEMRNIILHKYKLDITTETLLFFAARSHHCANVIKPALDAGKIVLSDRYVDSTYIYQSSDLESMNKLILWTNNIPNIIMPDFTLYFQVSAETACVRQSLRKSGTDIMEERSMRNLRTNIEKFEQLARIGNFVTIDAERDIDAVQQQCIQFLRVNDLCT